MNTTTNRFTRIGTLGTIGTIGTLVAGTFTGALLLTSLAGCNKAGEANAAAPTTTPPPPPPPIGTVIDDSVLTTKVKSALLASEDVKSLDIKVKTDKGVVMLSGFADNPTQIDRAVVVARNVAGVRSVDNQFSLKKGGQTVGHKIDDSIITTKIKSALLADDMMKSLDVAVITRNGEAQLSGFVNSPAQLSRAVEIAQNIEGVTRVVNHMDMKK